MTEQLNAGHWRLDPFKRIQVWVWEPGCEPTNDAFDEARDNEKPREPLPILHGTATGYAQHRYRGETACASCKKAESRSVWERRQRKKREAA